MSELSESDIKAIEEKWVAKTENAESGDALEQLRVEALGKKGEISQLMKLLGGMTPDERGIKGPLLNALKDTVATLIGDKKQSLADAELDARLAEERIDVTLPVRPEGEGSIHPVSQVIEEMTAIFADMGFSIAEGPDIEDDFHNFTALNFPPAHPARDMHDTFFLSQEDGVVPSKSGEGNEPPKVLRTHTSPVQIRHMMTHQPPIRIIVPGRTFRCDSDQTHTPMFHQIEGLVIDTETHMGHLKGCLVEFIKAYFEVDDLNYRFRPHYFPFTEPSAEMDIGYSVEDGNISIGTGEKFMEILGCGMVHPNVLKNCGLDPDTYQGFAFGLGVDRMAMLKYGIPDLRPFFEADMRWLKHYGFRPLDLPTLVGGIAR